MTSANGPDSGVGLNRVDVTTADGGVVRVGLNRVACTTAYSAKVRFDAIEEWRITIIACAAAGHGSAHHVLRHAISGPAANHIDAVATTRLEPQSALVVHSQLQRLIVRRPKKIHARRCARV